MLHWHPKSRRGFTLVELLVVIAIVATLATVVAPSLFRNVSDARGSAAKAQVQTLALALDTYRLDSFEYPTTAQGLGALRADPGQAGAASRWRGPYLQQEVPLDPWGRPFHYRSPGIVNPASYDLYTLGRDGLVGGEGEDADVTSWNGPVQR